MNGQFCRTQRGITRAFSVETANPGKIVITRTVCLIISCVKYRITMRRDEIATVPRMPSGPGWAEKLKFEF